MLATTPVLALGEPTNVAYVEVNSNALANAGCYVRTATNQPYFGMVSIFAANINGDSPDAPVLYLNPNVKAVLNSAQIEDLHTKHIKVLLTILGNHKKAGWACMTDEGSAKAFADSMVELVKRYNLDGIDIDDEYSSCKTNNTSLIMLAEAIKSNPDFSGKLLTKALFSDTRYFQDTYKGHKLAEYLDYGFEMSYTTSYFQKRLQVYLANGMTNEKLMLGGWTQKEFPSPVELGAYSRNNNLAGVMIYDVTKLKTTETYLSSVAMGEYNETVNVLPGCLK
jgi:GH18 family chitinase